MDRKWQDGYGGKAERHGGFRNAPPLIRFSSARRTMHYELRMGGKLAHTFVQLGIMTPDG